VFQLDKRNISWYEDNVSRIDRMQIKGHKSAILWFTGLSGSGKSTLSAALEKKLNHLKIHTFRLDGDNLRFGLNKDLGFSEQDRSENIRRIGEVAKLFTEAGILTLVAVISPFEKDRKMVRSLFNKMDYIEIYVKCSLYECEKRDPKGLYKKAHKGEIVGFTGVDSPYEEPKTPEIIIETDKLTVNECTDIILQYLKEQAYIPNII
jgi:adenylylsulfate kinase